MVGLQVKTPPCKLIILEQVMLPVPAYWSQRNHTTRQLPSAALQILLIPTLLSVDLFLWLCIFVLLWSFWLRLQFASPRDDNNQQLNENMDPNFHYKWSLYLLPMPFNINKYNNIEQFTAIHHNLVQVWKICQGKVCSLKK